MIYVKRSYLVGAVLVEVFGDLVRDWFCLQRGLDVFQFRVEIGQKVLQLRNLVRQLVLLGDWAVFLAELVELESQTVDALVDDLSRLAEVLLCRVVAFLVAVRHAKVVVRLSDSSVHLFKVLFLQGLIKFGYLYMLF